MSGSNNERMTGKQGSWSKDDLLLALRRVKRNETTIWRASKQSGIPYATLKHQWGRFMENEEKWIAEYIPRKVLTSEDERALELAMINLFKKRIKVDEFIIRRVCFVHCQSNGIINKFDKVERLAGKKWYAGFIKRHPVIPYLISHSHSTTNNSCQMI